jgi:hypothetical protein
LGQATAPTGCVCDCVSACVSVVCVLGNSFVGTIIHHSCIKQKYRQNVFRLIISVLNSIIMTTQTFLATGTSHGTLMFGRHTLDQTHKYTRQGNKRKTVMANRKRTVAESTTMERPLETTSILVPFGRGNVSKKVEH